MTTGERPPVLLGGRLGDALMANHRGRLTTFISGPSSPAVRLFDPAVAAHNHAGDWNGEHVGKWLIASCRAAARTGDVDLSTRIRAVADFLVGCQEPSGYLGTYAPGASSRMTTATPSSPTWDVWVHAYAILGLLEAHRLLGDDRYVEAAARAGDLCWDVIARDGVPMRSLGSHDGLSATVILEPAVELFLATGDARYRDLAFAIVDQIEGRSELGLVSRSLTGTDVYALGDGKIYQLLWTFVGLAKLSAATGQEELVRAVERAWQNVVDHHLTPAGGPWGGVGRHSSEVFNPQGFFSPLGAVETCSTMAWIQLNRELHRQTSDVRYADEIEKAVHGALLGAQHPNGEDWAYFSFPNGQRSHADPWDCCKSSGALALEEIGVAALGVDKNGVSVHLYAPLRVRVATPLASADLVMETDYPSTGVIKLRLEPTDNDPIRTSLNVRIPEWAAGASATIQGDPVGPVEPGSYLRIARDWRATDELNLNLPIEPRILERSYSVHHNDKEIQRVDYLSMSAGPVSFATTRMEGDVADLRSRTRPAVSDFQRVQTPAEFHGPSFELTTGIGAPMLFQPYFEAGGHEPGSWRSTWLLAGAVVDDSR